MSNDSSQVEISNKFINHGYRNGFKSEETEVHSIRQMKLSLSLHSNSALEIFEIGSTGNNTNKFSGLILWKFRTEFSWSTQQR